MAMLRAGRDDVNRWTVAAVGGDQALLASVKGAVGGLYYLAELQLSYLDCIPYLLARLGEPGVAARSLLQYLSAR